MATFTVSVNEQFEVSVTGMEDAEQSSHLFTMLQMTKLQRAQDLTRLPHNLVTFDAGILIHTARDTAMKTQGIVDLWGTMRDDGTR
jgi:hypothetical protein